MAYKNRDFVCQRCGSPFQSIERTARFCCRACYLTWREEQPLAPPRRPPHAFVCEVCGLTFWSKHKVAHVCSVACRRELASRLHKGKVVSAETRARLSAAKTAHGPLKPRQAKTCIECGEQFTVRTKAQREQAKFCSRECQAAYWQKHGRPTKPTLPPIERVCKHCGSTFVPSRADLGAQTAGSRQFCCHGHFHAYRREHPESFPGFKGGAFRSHGGYGPNWPQQSRLARERDGHTCRGCGREQLSPALDVHHLRPRREFGDDYLAANDLENLISLCKACHKRWEDLPPPVEIFWDGELLVRA